MRQTPTSNTNQAKVRQAPQTVGPHSRSPGPRDPGARVERLYEDYSARVYRYCLSRLDSPEEAEDALQATYLNAWRSLSGGVEPLSPRPWLFQIAANVCSGILRTHLSGAAVELRDPEALDRIATGAEPSDDLLGLSAALEQLPERQRRALLLRDWRGLSYDEIATQLNSSYQAVETLLFRARKSVATGLRDPQPERVSVRARALAPLPLLFPLKQGVSAVKSAFSASIAPMKVSLGIALGAAAPLVAYGLFEQGIAHHGGATTKAAAPAAQLETPLTYTIPAPAAGKKVAPALVPLEDMTWSSPSTQSPVSHGVEGTAGSPAVHEHGSGPGSSSGPGSDPGPQPPPTTTDPPPGDDDPPPSGDEDPPPTGNVTICHHTGSKKNPDVTITVGPAAVDAHLAHGDELGACAAD